MLSWLVRALTCICLLLGSSVATTLASPKQYQIILNDGTEILCAIITNDPQGRRLQFQEQDKPELVWLSYYKIKAIVEESTQLDVTGQFVNTPPLSTIPREQPAPQSEPAPVVVNKGMGSGAVIAVSILGTIVALVIIGALAN